VALRGAATIRQIATRQSTHIRADIRSSPRQNPESDGCIVILTMRSLNIKLSAQRPPGPQLIPGISHEIVLRVEGEAAMAIMQINVERFSITSSKSFEDIVTAVEKQIGHPNMRQFLTHIGASRNKGELEKVVSGAVGRSGLMEFMHFDLGHVLRKELGENAPRVVRLLVGNPVTMKKMVKFVHDAGSYAPVTILIDERPDGVHLSYDRMASFLSSYGNSKALEVAKALDATVEALLKDAAG
jgi:uncharacterized protein (DUF302 family)